jgi:hypothetical protein
MKGNLCRNFVVQNLKRVRQKTGDVIPRKIRKPMGAVVLKRLPENGDESRDKNGLAQSKAVAWDFSVGT